MEVLGHEFNAVQLRLLIYSSKVSLQFILLHKAKKFPPPPPIPLAHAANMKEIYEGMKLLLGKFKYDEFK